MKTLRWMGTVVLWLVSLAGCTTVGIGSGELLGAGGAPASVAFEWRSTDGGMSGTLTATLPEASYEGRFFQVTQETRGELLAPLWMHWRRNWYDWPYDSSHMPAPYTTTQFITHYSGRVVATLESPGQPRMRCRFHLQAPARGMKGGGEGECQLADGRRVRAVLTPA
jgi:hypothetical protein